MGTGSEPAHRTRIWNDPVWRALILQALLAAAVALFVYFIVSNTLHNLAQRGITTGFGFLEVEAGFGILQTLITYVETDTYGRTFVVGLLNTVLVSVLGIVVATGLGFLIGVARLSHNWLLARLATAYVELFRNIPLLLQIFFWYFAVLRTLPGPRQAIEVPGGYLNVRGLYLSWPVPEAGFGWVWLAFAVGIGAAWLLARWSRVRMDRTGRPLPVLWPGLGLVLGLPLACFLMLGAPLHWDQPQLQGFNFRGGVTLIPELLALWFALSIYTAAFIAEIVRAGILAVPSGQREAASALGLSRLQTLRLIIIPQAMRVIIPPLTSQYLNLIKNSSLATAIGYPDLVSVFAGTTLNQTGQAIEVITMTMLVYLSLSLLTSLLMNWYNRRSALVER